MLTMLAAKAVPRWIMATRPSPIHRALLRSRAIDRPAMVLRNPLMLPCTGRNPATRIPVRGGEAVAFGRWRSRETAHAKPLALRPSPIHRALLCSRAIDRPVMVLRNPLMLPRTGRNPIARIPVRGGKAGHLGTSWRSRVDGAFLLR